jgi:hypothetical protein
MSPCTMRCSIADQISGFLLARSKEKRIIEAITCISFDLI